jgi:PAS domain S-box-containing protein
MKPMDSDFQSRDQLLEELEGMRRRIAMLEEEQVNRERNSDDVDLFRRLVEHSLGLMCVHDLDGNLLFVNTAAAEALGFRPEDGVGWNLRRFLSPSVESQFDVYLERIREHGVDSGLMRLVGKNGTEQVWLYRNVLYEELGKPPRVLGHAQDVTDRVRAEQALKQSEQRFRLLADTALILIWMSDRAGDCVFLNRAWLEFTGKALEEQLGDGWIENIHAADRDQFVEAHCSAMAAGTPFQVEYRLRRADGEYRWVFCSGVPRVANDGAFAGFIGSCVDISPIRQAREALEAAREDLGALVARRTAELERTYIQLGAAVHHRARIEDERARVHRLDAGAGQAGLPGATLAWGPQKPDRAKTVLLVEARTDVRHLLRDILQLDGYRVIDVGDVQAALAVIEAGSEPVHLLLTTIATLGTSGPTVVDRIAAVRPGLSILYMSDSSLEVTAHQGGFEPGGVSLSRRPPTLTDLLGKVREAIDR